MPARKSPPRPAAPVEGATLSDYILNGPQVVGEMVREIERIERPDWRILTVGEPSLDEALTLIPGNVTTVAARPGGGKTTFCEYMTARELAALEAAESEDGCVIYVSLESPAFMLGMHIAKLGAQGFVTRDMYRKRVDLTAAKRAALATLSARTMARMFVVRHPGVVRGRVAHPVSTQIIKHAVKQIYTSWGKKPTLFVIDFIQRVSESDFSGRAGTSIRENIIACMSEAVVLGQSTGAHVLVAVQASREVDNLSPPVPHLGNMLESAAIEQLCDNNIGIGRPITSPKVQEVIRESPTKTAEISVRLSEDEPTKRYSITRGTTIVQINKCRNDPPGGRAVFDLNPATLTLTIPVPISQEAPPSWAELSDPTFR